MPSHLVATVTDRTGPVIEPVSPERTDSRQRDNINQDEKLPFGRTASCPVLVAPSHAHMLESRDVAGSSCGWHQYEFHAALVGELGAENDFQYAALLCEGHTSCCACCFTRGSAALRPDSESAQIVHFCLVLGHVARTLPGSATLDERGTSVLEQLVAKPRYSARTFCKGGSIHRRNYSGATELGRWSHLTTGCSLPINNSSRAWP